MYPGEEVEKHEQTWLFVQAKSLCISSTVASIAYPQYPLSAPGRSFTKNTSNFLQSEDHPGEGAKLSPRRVVSHSPEIDCAAEPGGLPAPACGRQGRQAGAAGLDRGVDAALLLTEVVGWTR